MSIWATRVVFDDDSAPYIDFYADDDHYVSKTTLPSAKRAGWMGLSEALSFGVPMIRVDVEESAAKSLQVFLDPKQATKVRDYLTDWLERAEKL